MFEGYDFFYCNLVQGTGIEHILVKLLCEKRPRVLRATL